MNSESRTIWKFALELTDMPTVWMPDGARILDVQVQRGRPQVWALVDPNASLVPRYLVLIGTGHIHPVEFMSDCTYIGTFQAHDGNLAFHVFEIEATIEEDRR